MSRTLRRGASWPGGRLPGVAGAETAMGRACGHPTGVGRWRVPSPARRGDAPGRQALSRLCPPNHSHPEPATRRDPAIGTTGPSAGSPPRPWQPRRSGPMPTRPDEPRAVGGWRSVTVRATGCHHAPVTLSRSPPHRPTPTAPLTPGHMARTHPHTPKTLPLNATWPNPAPALRNPTPNPTVVFRSRPESTHAVPLRSALRTGGRHQGRRPAPLPAPPSRPAPPPAPSVRNSCPNH